MVVLFGEAMHKPRLIRGYFKKCLVPTLTLLSVGEIWLMMFINCSTISETYPLMRKWHHTIYGKNQAEILSMSIFKHLSLIFSDSVSQLKKARLLGTEMTSIKSKFNVKYQLIRKTLLRGFWMHRLYPPPRVKTFTHPIWYFMDMALNCSW